MWWVLGTAAVLSGKGTKCVLAGDGTTKTSGSSAPSPRPSSDATCFAWTLLDDISESLNNWYSPSNASNGNLFKLDGRSGAIFPNLLEYKRRNARFYMYVMMSRLVSCPHFDPHFFLYLHL